MSENLWDSVLDESSKNAVRNALKQSESPMTTEIEVGSPDGVFVGVSGIDESDAYEIVVYVYVADPGTHTEFDPTSETTATRKQWLSAETKQLSQLSSELLDIVDSTLDVEVEEEKLRRVDGGGKFYDSSELGNGEYYALKL